MLTLMTAALGATSCFEGEEGWVASPEGRCYRLTQPVTAKCYREGDRQRLLAVVEAGFGDFDGFNRIVRGIFVDARTQNLEAQVAAQAAAMKRLATLRPEDFDGPLSA